MVVSVLFHYAFPVEEFVDSDSFRAPREQPWEGGASAQIEGGQSARGVNPDPCTLHPAPCTLHPAPLHPAP